MEAYEAQKYQSVEGTLGALATNSLVPFGPLGEAIMVSITNDNGQSDFTVKFNGVNDTTSPARTIQGGETLALSNISLKSIHLTNRSGVAIAYRIIFWGN